jgi:hypothetical protein
MTGSSFVRIRDIFSQLIELQSERRRDYLAGLAGLDAFNGVRSCPDPFRGGLAKSAWTAVTKHSNHRRDRISLWVS